MRTFFIIANGVLSLSANSAESIHTSLLDTFSFAEELASIDEFCEEIEERQWISLLEEFPEQFRDLEEFCDAYTKEQLTARLLEFRLHLKASGPADTLKVNHLLDKAEIRWNDPAFTLRGWIRPSRAIPPRRTQSQRLHFEARGLEAVVGKNRWNFLSQARTLPEVYRITLKPSRGEISAGEFTDSGSVYFFNDLMLPLEFKTQMGVLFKDKIPRYFSFSSALSEMEFWGVASAHLDSFLTGYRYSLQRNTLSSLRLQLFQTLQKGRINPRLFYQSSFSKEKIWSLESGFRGAQRLSFWEVEALWRFRQSSDAQRENLWSLWIRPILFPLHFETHRYSKGSQRSRITLPFSALKKTSGSLLNALTLWGQITHSRQYSKNSYSQQWGSSYHYSSPLSSFLWKGSWDSRNRSSVKLSGLWSFRSATQRAPNSNAETIWLSQIRLDGIFTPTGKPQSFSFKIVLSI